MSRKNGTMRHFAVRRVNPFAGVLQVIEGDSARAYSSDGRVWQIQVLAQRPDNTWRGFSDVPPIYQFFNFGQWDEENGLYQIPANPLMDIGGMTAAADALTERLPALLDQLPFTLCDRYECWSTDLHGEPVALLATTNEHTRIGEIRPGRWQAARTADHGFVSASLLAHGVPAHGELGPRQHAEQLERLVRRLGQHKAWFERTDVGLGIRLTQEGGRTDLPARPLPPLGLKTDLAGALEQALVEDYLGWQAPQLLTLQAIPDAQRAWLEARACRRAEQLAAVYRLIPHILDHHMIEAARVEALLRRAAH